jgi:hypothetical protein
MSKRPARPRSRQPPAPRRDCRARSRVKARPGDCPSPFLTDLPTRFRARKPSGSGLPTGRTTTRVRISSGAAVRVLTRRARSDFRECGVGLEDVGPAPPRSCRPGTRLPRPSRLLRPTDGISDLGPRRAPPGRRPSPSRPGDEARPWARSHGPSRRSRCKISSSVTTSRAVAGVIPVPALECHLDLAHQCGGPGWDGLSSSPGTPRCCLPR